MIIRSTKPVTIAALRHSGTHLFIPIVSRISGGPVDCPKGQNSLVFEPGPIVIVFTRDPRNWLIAAIRYKRGRDFFDHPNDATIIEFLKRRKEGQTFIEHATSWATRWLDWPHALRLRFEDFHVREDGVRAVTQIAEHVGKPADAGAIYDEFYGKSHYQGRHSDWTKCFGKEAHIAWKKAGGDDLVTILGYEP